jgi:regulator of protease activity HflC (stomatin/prohibitin superfamily)
MWKTFYVKPNERGVLYNRSDFQRILLPGLYRYPVFSAQRVETYDATQPEAQLENLELLLQLHGTRLDRHLLVVQTNFNEAALVQCGRKWFTMAPNQLRAFWRGFAEVQVHRFNLDETLELPSQFVQQMQGLRLDGLTKFQVSEAEVGFLFVQDNFVRPLESGEYAFWNFNRKVAVRNLSRVIPNPSFPQPEVLMERHLEFVSACCESVQLSGHEVAIVRYQSKVIAVLSPCSRQLFWRGVEVEVIDFVDQPKLPQRLVVELVSGLSEVLLLCHEMMHMQEVPAQHVGLLYLDGELQSTLPPGLHGWWQFGRSFKTEAIDLRLQTLEVSGQEILSKDKVPLRLNLTAAYRVVDPVRAKTALTDVSGFLYKELQFGLRSAVGTKSLDALLEDKGAIDVAIAEHIREKTAGYGLEVDSVGVKDIILPGEIKAILSKVVEAEKAAQANVVRRREETAATRSMLNTAKVMEDNPVALRLKELEILERISEKIDRINVSGGLDSILNELIRIKDS